VGELLALVRDRAARRGLAGLDVRAAFLGHAAPSLPGALGAVAAGHSRCVVVPLLLTAAFHSERDIPRQVARDRSAYPMLRVRVAAPLGPHPLLLRALERRLAQVYAGPRPRTGVVLAAAGSGDAAANAAVAAVAASWERDGGWRRVVPGYASACPPSPGEAAARLAADGPVVVATYLLAPGVFADRVRAAADGAGAAAVSGALGAVPEVADVVLARYAAAVRARGGAPPLAGAAGAERPWRLPLLRKRPRCGGVREGNGGRTPDQPRGHRGAHNLAGIDSFTRARCPAPG
jgi:sirohydrochlorin ferrochelatase